MLVFGAVIHACYEVFDGESSLLKILWLNKNSSGLERKPVGRGVDLSGCVFTHVDLYAV